MRAEGGEVKGSGRPGTRVRTAPGGWPWRTAVTAAVGVMGLLALLLIGAETGAEGLLAGLGLAVLPVPLYVKLALWLDRFEAEPAHMLARTFFWGAAGAVFFSLVVTTTVSFSLGESAATLLSAPLVEEVTKALVLFLFFFRYRDEFDNVTDGVVYAAMVGLGFATTENVLFYGVALRDGADLSMALVQDRGVLAPFAHPLFTAMTGIGLGVARETRRRALRWVAPPVGLGAAVGLHALWNAAAVGGAFFPVYLRVMVPVFCGVLALVAYSLRREGRTLRLYLAPCVEDGTLAAEELERMCTVRGRLAASLGALRRGGAAEWRREGELHQAASELAFHRWRVGRGISRGARLDRERETRYLSRMRALRASAPTLNGRAL